MSRGGPHPVNTVRVEAVKLIRKKKKGFTRTHADTHTSFSALHLCVSSSSPLCCPYRKPPLTSRRLCFCLDLRIEFFRGAPAIKYGIEIAPLFLLRQGVGVGGRGGGDKLPPSITPLCSLFSSERITSFTPHLRAFPQVHHGANIQKHMSTTRCVHIDMYIERRGVQKLDITDQKD